MRVDGSQADKGWAGVKIGGQSSVSSAHIFLARSMVYNQCNIKSPETDK